MKLIGITVGDPAGVGPEVAERALKDVIAAHPDDRSNAYRLFGPAPIVEDVCAGIVRDIPGAAGRVFPSSTTHDMAGVVTGRYSTMSGRAALDALEAAVAELGAGHIFSLVTGPISKQTFADAGMEYPGQTEFVADRLGCTDFAMMLGGPRLRVALATTHLAIRDVPAAITTDGVLRITRICDRFCRDHLGIAAPRIAVCGLNPHCGDQGRFGDEEGRVIAPAIAAARRDGIDATGPLPADTAFFQAYGGGFDMVLAMYHDQGLGPLKLVHFHDAINVTMGLPRIRCSCDHGPAWDIAGKGMADHRSMTAAIRFASGLGMD
jgi:4-hydroxythreonine-4-phosphate dehydrogenase